MKIIKEKLAEFRDYRALQAEIKQEFTSLDQLLEDNVDNVRNAVEAMFVKGELFGGLHSRIGKVLDWVVKNSDQLGSKLYGQILGDAEFWAAGPPTNFKELVDKHELAA